MSLLDWPSLFVGLVALMYWWQWVELICVTRKATAAARRVPPDRVSRLLRMFWYPNVVAWTVVPFVSAFPGSTRWAGFSRLCADSLTH